MSLLVRGARILTQDAQRRTVDGDVLVEDGKIAKVGGVIKAKVDETIDAKGKLLIPGLVNTHTHLPMVLFRGWGDDLLLDDWLKTRIWPAEDKMNESDMRAGTRLAALEMIESGTTCFNDMYFFEDAVADEAEQAGLRGWAGFGMVDAGKVGPDEPNPKMAECEAFVKKWAKKGRVRASPAPHAPYTCGPVTYRRTMEIAEKYDTVLHTHMSETRGEVYDVEKTRGARPPKYLENSKALGKRSVLAHCGWVTKDEVNAVAKAGASVSHNPVSNMKLATGGACPVPEFLAAKADVGLGTDGAASNNSLDMFETMKFAALLHKHLRWDAKLLPAQTIFDLATRGGAAALKWGDRIGSIEVGKRADLVLVDLDDPRLRPMHDPVSQLVYAGPSRPVHATIVDGAVLKLGDEFRTLKPDAVIQAAEKAAGRLTAA
ncbi:MAG: amidohydrolase [Euryarchaeota archaeon]|nr:amidohydrolase [Euryarchaeota archaeon]